MSRSCSLPRPALPAISLMETNTNRPRLPVNADSCRELRRLAKHLAQRRVRVYVRADLPGRCLDKAGQRGLRDDDPLRCCHVCQQQAADGVSNRVYARLGGAIAFVDPNPASLDQNVCALQTQVLGHSYASYGDERDLSR